MTGMWGSLFVGLLLAHLMGDFMLQTDSLCKQKREKKTGSWFLYVHAIVISMLSLIALWNLRIDVGANCVSGLVTHRVEVRCPSLFSPEIIEGEMVSVKTNDEAEVVQKFDHLKKLIFSKVRRWPTEVEVPVLNNNSRETLFS